MAGREAKECNATHSFSLYHRDICLLLYQRSQRQSNWLNHCRLPHPKCTWAGHSKTPPNRTVIHCCVVCCVYVHMCNVQNNVAKVVHTLDPAAMATEYCAREVCATQWAGIAQIINSMRSGCEWEWEIAGTRTNAFPGGNMYIYLEDRKRVL